MTVWFALALLQSLPKLKKAFVGAPVEKRVALVNEMGDDEKSLEALGWIVAGDPAADVQLAAVRKLAPHASEKKVADALVRAVLGEFIAGEPFRESGGGVLPHVRRQIAAALRSAPPELKMPKEHRALAAEFFGDIGLVKPLADLRDDKDPIVRRAALRALGCTYQAAARDALKDWPDAQDALARLDRWEKVSGPADVPDEKYRDEDTPESVEIVFLIDVGQEMKGLIPSVTRLVRKAVEERKCSACVVTMRNGDHGPEVAALLDFTSDFPAVIAAVNGIEIQKQRTVRIRDDRALEAALRFAAHRVGWSRRSTKQIIAFSAEANLERPEYDAQLTADFKRLESGKVTIHHTVVKAPLPAELKEIGSAVRLINAVPGTITVILRGAAVTESTVKKIFGVKKASLLTRATNTTEATFDNKDTLDVDALFEFTRKPHDGVDDLVFVNPMLDATYRGLTFSFTAHEICYSATEVKAIAAVYAMKGVASAGAEVTSKVEIEEKKKPPAGGCPCHPGGGGGGPKNDPEEPLFQYDVTVVVFAVPAVTDEQLRQTLTQAGFGSDEKK